MFLTLSCPDVWREAGVHHTLVLCADAVLWEDVTFGP